MPNQITPDIARELWDQTPHNWNDFCQTLQTGGRAMNNLDASFREELCVLARRMQVDGTGFPTSAENLYQTFVDQLGLHSRR